MGFLKKSLRIHRTSRAEQLLSEYVCIDDGIVKPKRQAPIRPQIEKNSTEEKPNRRILDQSFDNDIERILSIPKHEIAYYYLVLGLDHTKSPSGKEIIKKYR